MADEQTLAKRIREKYPDAYKNISDVELESLVIAKYPGIYDHLPRTSKPSMQAAPAPSMLRRAANAVLPDEMVDDVASTASRSSAFLGEMLGNVPSSASNTVMGIVQGVPALAKQMWDKPVETPCPECEAPFVVEKTTKRAGTVRRCLKEGCDFQENVGEPTEVAS